MGRDTLYLHRILFKNKVYSARAQVWEDLFCAVMSKEHPDFETIKAHSGDGGNDGYRHSQGIYYACYGPEEEQKESTLTYAHKKAKDDFDKLVKNWHPKIPVRRYYPVFNDRYWGISSEMSQLMIKLKKDHALEDASFFLPQHLENIFITLPEEERDELIFFGPDPERISSQVMDYEILGEVVGYLLENRKPIALQKNLSTPEYEEKIKFNLLCEQWSNLLTSSYCQIRVVKDFLKKDSNFARQNLREVMAQKYKDAQGEISDSDLKNQGINKSDLVFLRILESSTPYRIGWTSGKVAMMQDAVLAIMAYYFEACDIFEPPPAKLPQL